MKSPLLHTAAYNDVCDWSLWQWFFSLHARKCLAIWENWRGNWLTISLPLTTFKAYLSMGLLNSCLATSFLPINGFYTSLKTWYLCTTDLKLSEFDCSMLFTAQASLVGWLQGCALGKISRSLKVPNYAIQGPQHKAYIKKVSLSGRPKTKVSRLRHLGALRAQPWTAWLLSKYVSFFSALLVFSFKFHRFHFNCGL